MIRFAVALILFAVLSWPTRAQTFIRSLPTSTNLTSSTKVPVDDATYGTRAVTVQNLLASTATNATLLAAITNVVEDTATAILGNKLNTTNGTAVNLTGSLTNATYDGAYLRDVKVAFVQNLQTLLSDSSPTVAKLAYVLNDDSSGDATRGTYRYDPTLTGAETSTVFQCQDQGGNPATPGRWVRMSAGDNYQMSVDTLDDALAVTPAYLAAGLNPTNSIKLTVKTRARTALGSGGSKNYYYSTTAPAATNYGTVTAYGSGYLVWDGEGPLTPQMFGAKADGVTDDSAAIQRCVDAAPAGGEIFFSRGSYRFANINVNKPLTFSGTGPGTRQWTDTISGGSATNNFNGAELEANANGWLFIVQPSSTNHVDVEQCLLPVTFRNLALKGSRRAYFTDGTTGAGGIWLDHCFSPFIENCSFDSFRRSSIYLNSSVREASFVNIHSRYCGDRAAATPYPDWSFVDQSTDTNSASASNDRHNMIRVVGSQSVFSMGNALEIGTVQPVDNGRVVNGLRFVDCMFHGFSTTTDGGAFNGTLEMTNATRQAYRLTQLYSASDVEFTSCLWNFGGVAVPTIEFASGTGQLIAGYETARNVRINGGSIKGNMLGGSAGTTGIYAQVGSGTFSGIQIIDRATQIDTASTFTYDPSVSGYMQYQVDDLLPILRLRRISEVTNSFDLDFYGAGGYTTLYSTHSVNGGVIGITDSLAASVSKNASVATYSYSTTANPSAMIAGQTTSTLNNVKVGGTFEGNAFDATSVDIVAAANNTSTNTAATVRITPNLVAVTGAITAGAAADSANRLTLTGGASGGSILGLRRTSGATVSYDFSLSGSGLNFSDAVVSRTTMATYGNASQNEIYAGARSTAASHALPSVFAGASFAATAGTDVAGVRTDIIGGLGTGAGTPGSILFKVGATGASGTTPQSASVTALTLAGNTGNATFGGVVTAPTTLELGHASDTTLARSAAGVVTIEGVKIATQPTTETLTYSSTTVTVTAGKGPNQSSSLTCTNNFTLTFASVADNDGGTIWVHPAATNCTVTLSSPAYGPSGTTLTITGGTGSTNHTVLAWKATTVNSTNVINVNALNYYR